MKISQLNKETSDSIDTFLNQINSLVKGPINNPNNENKITICDLIICDIKEINKSYQEEKDKYCL